MRELWCLNYFRLRCFVGGLIHAVYKPHDFLSSNRIKGLLTLPLRKLTLSPLLHFLNICLQHWSGLHTRCPWGLWLFWRPWKFVNVLLFELSLTKLKLLIGFTSPWVGELFVESLKVFLLFTYMAQELSFTLLRHCHLAWFSIRLMIIARSTEIIFRVEFLNLFPRFYRWRRVILGSVVALNLVIPTLHSIVISNRCNRCYLISAALLRSKVVYGPTFCSSESLFHRESGRLKGGSRSASVPTVIILGIHKRSFSSLARVLTSIKQSFGQLNLLFHHLVNAGVNKNAILSIHCELAHGALCCPLDSLRTLYSGSDWRPTTKWVITIGVLLNFVRISISLKRHSQALILYVFFVF